MALLSKGEWVSAKAIAQIAVTNPFLPERTELERKALGQDSVMPRRFVHYRPDASVRDMFPNTGALQERGDGLLEKMRVKLEGGASAGEEDLLVYEQLAYYLLFSRFVSLSNSEMTVREYEHRAEKRIVASYDGYRKAFDRFLRLPGRRFPWGLDPDVLFAFLFQVERAFIGIFSYIVGGSTAAARLRAAVWESIFTRDIRRYARALHGLLGNVATLVTGPSGTGKELIARAVARSRFIPFDPRRRRFATDAARCFHGLNLSALSPTLIESELFGHVKGAFSGATRDHFGYLDENVCDAWGTVFLDEIGDVDRQIQVKLLRVLENREFRRVGDVTVRSFPGKLVAATNRDLAAGMDAGTIREDFYYRLCADRIVTPSLRDQLEEKADELGNFVRFIASRLLPGFPEEAEKLADQAVAWIDEHLGPDYPWPGNIRELEQCVRSILVRGSYAPTRRGGGADRDGFLEAVRAGRLTCDELLERYFIRVHAKHGSYRATARALDTDWRTVQRFVTRGLARRQAESE